jgi:protocatechuate 3,4-dioxygenase beta subunit
MDSLYVLRGRSITQETEDMARYQIDGIAPGSYTVTVTQQLKGILRRVGVPYQQSKPLTLRDGEDAVLDFDLRTIPEHNYGPAARADGEGSPKLIKVTGLVKDPQGRPVSGTSVTLFQTKLEYVTDAEGEFSASLAPSDKMRYFFAVHKQRKLVASGRLAGGKLNVEINLIPAIIVSGRVLDPDGRPVSGVQVAPLPMTCFHVLTDSEGRFDVGWSPKWHAPDHELCLMARHTELNLAAVVDIAPEAKTIDIELEPALALRGTVEDANGQPILGAVVGLSLIRGWGAGTPVRDVITDYQGGFELPALPQRQEYGVGANAEGYQRNAIKTEVINNITNHEEVGPIVLKRKEESKEAGRVILKLVGPDSQPVVGAWVGTFVDWSDIAESPPIWFLNDGGSYKASKIDSAAKVISDEEGKITLTEEELFKPQWPTERTVPLTAIDEGHHLAGLRELSREDLGTEVTVTLQPGCHVRGRVSAATARKRKWSRTLTVYVYWQAHRPCQYTSKEGRFEFVLPPGKYKVQVYSEDSDKDVILPILIKPGQRDLDITEYLDDESKLPAPTASIAVDAKDETFFDAIDTEGGAKDVRLVVDPRFGPRPAQAANSARQRVVSFPEGWSMGKLFARDAGPDSWYEGWQELAEAKGDVSVAVGKEVKLQISEQAAGDLSALDKLGPDDLQMLSFGWKAVRVGSLAPIGNLKGLKALNIQSARFRMHKSPKQASRVSSG